jgi:hypothetical protein
MENGIDFQLSDQLLRSGATSTIQIGNFLRDDLRQKHGSEVVIKIFTQAFVKEDIHMEMAIMSQFKHPNIIQLLGYCETASVVRNVESTYHDCFRIMPLIFIR